MITSADQVFAIPIPTREVTVPEWGDTVLVRALSPRARIAIIDVLTQDKYDLEAYEADQAKPAEDREGVTKPLARDDSILTVIFCVVGPDLKPVFTIGDYDRFLDLSYTTLQEIYQQIRFLQAGIDAPEEQKKSSVTPRKRGSSSSSRVTSAKR